MKSFFESQFGYCPLVWMFYNRGINNKINHLHERVVHLRNYLKKIIRFQYTIETYNL